MSPERHVQQKTWHPQMESMNKNNTCLYGAENFCKVWHAQEITIVRFNAKYKHRTLPPDVSLTNHVNAHRIDQKPLRQLIGFLETVWIKICVTSEDHQLLIFSYKVQQPFPFLLNSSCAYNMYNSKMVGFLSVYTILNSLTLKRRLHIP